MITLTPLTEAASELACSELLPCDEGLACSDGSGPSMTSLTEGTETLTALAEDVQVDYILLPGAATFPGATTFPGEYHIGLRLDTLSED